MQKFFKALAKVFFFVILCCSSVYAENITGSGNEVAENTDEQNSRRQEQTNTHRARVLPHLVWYLCWEQVVPPLCKDEHSRAPNLGRVSPGRQLSRGTMAGRSRRPRPDAFGRVRKTQKQIDKQIINK